MLRVSLLDLPVQIPHGPHRAVLRWGGILTLIIAHRQLATREALAFRNEKSFRGRKDNGQTVDSATNSQEGKGPLYACKLVWK